MTERSIFEDTRLGFFDTLVDLLLLLGSTAI